MSLDSCCSPCTILQYTLVLSSKFADLVYFSTAIPLVIIRGLLIQEDLAIKMGILLDSVFDEVDAPGPAFVIEFNGYDVYAP